LTRNDISRFINDKLKNKDYMRHLLAEDFHGGSSLVYEISEKADGVWLWVALVVKSLIQGLRSGDRLCDLRRRLAVLPSGIEDLYAHMLKSINPLYLQESSKIFQIFRASGHELNMFELERAVRFSDYREVISMQVLDRSTRKLNSMHSDSNIERILMMINSRCKGLLEVTNPSPGHYTFPVVTGIQAPAVPTTHAGQVSDCYEAATWPTKKWYITSESQPNLAPHAQHNPDATVEPSTGAKTSAGNQKDLNMEWDMNTKAPPASVFPGQLDSNATFGTWVRRTARQENGDSLEQVHNSLMGCGKPLNTSETGADWGSDAEGEPGRLSPWSYEGSAKSCPRITSVDQDVSMHDYMDCVTHGQMGPASEHTSAAGVSSRNESFPWSMSGINYPNLVATASKTDSINEQCEDPSASQLNIYEAVDEGASSEAEYFDELGKPYPQPDVPQVVYLHRTAREYLEKAKVWEMVLSLTKDVEFDPYNALLMSYVIEAKTTNRVDRAQSIYDAGLEVFCDVSKLDIEPAASHLALVEALDNAFTNHWTGQRCELTHGHWSNSNLEWDQDEQETRRVWQGDVNSMALKAELSWYLDARISDGNLARPGLPLLAYAIGLDEWASPHYRLKIVWIQHLLSLGADPNEHYHGYTIWQYFLHYIHGMYETSTQGDHDLGEVFQIFQMMLEYGADPLACCVEDDSSWASAVQLEAGGAGYSLREAANHAMAGGKSHQQWCKVCTTSGNIHQNNHSVTVIICGFRRHMTVPASLLSMLEEKKQAVEGQQKAAREQNAAHEQQESANRLRKARRKEKKKRRKKRASKCVK
jgi:hypothetical protein